MDDRANDAVLHGIKVMVRGVYRNYAEDGKPVLFKSEAKMEKKRAALRRQPEFKIGKNGVSLNRLSMTSPQSPEPTEDMLLIADAIASSTPVDGDDFTSRARIREYLSGRIAQALAAQDAATRERCAKVADAKMADIKLRRDRRQSMSIPHAYYLSGAFNSASAIVAAIRAKAPNKMTPKHDNGTRTSLHLRLAMLCPRLSHGETEKARRRENEIPQCIEDGERLSGNCRWAIQIT